MQRYLSEKDINEIISALHNVTSRYQSSDFSISLAGTPIMFNALKKSMMNDMRIFLKLSVIIIALFLLLLFRRISGVIHMKFKIEDLVIPVEIRPQGTMVRLTHIIETSLSYGIRLDNEKMVAFRIGIDYIISNNYKL